MFKKMLFSCVILCSILSCQKEKLKKTYSDIKSAPGPEDIVFDKVNNRILLSCNERRTGMPQLGEIQQLDIRTDETSTLPLLNLPAIPFNPHGFDLQTINGVDYLYVINHYKDGSNISSVVKFKINTDYLEFVFEFKNLLLISPNDLTVLPNGSFYFSNDKNSQDITELLTNPYSGSIVYCDGNDNWKKTDSSLGFPNGLCNQNNILYLGTSRNHALFTYDIQTDGMLKNRKVLSRINGIDNISIAGNELIAAVHPDEIKFALLSYIPTTLSPSNTYAINMQTGSARAIFSDNGKLISGSSTALVINENLYLAQVFGEFIMKITNYDN